MGSHITSRPCLWERVAGVARGLKERFKSLLYIKAVYPLNIDEYELPIYILDFNTILKR